MNLLTSRNRLMDFQNKIMVAGGKDGIVRRFGKDMDTLLYLKWITSNDLQHMKPCSVLSGSLDGRAVCGRISESNKEKTGGQESCSLRRPLPSATPAPNGMAWHSLQGHAWLGNMEFLSLTPAWPLSLMSFHPDNTTVSWYGHHSLRAPSKHLCQVNYMKRLPSWKECCLVFSQLETEFGYGFELLTFRTSSSTTSGDVSTARSTSVVPHHHTLNRARNVTAGHRAMDSCARNPLVLII